MSREDLTSPVAAAATAQVKLCPYNEEEPHIWFRLINGIPKTAIIMPFGLFEYLFAPFGLSNAAQTFQRMMDRTTDGLEGLFAYMDESRVGSLDRQTHLRHLEAFFTALAANGLAYVKTIELLNI